MKEAPWVMVHETSWHEKKFSITIAGKFDPLLNQGCMHIWSPSLLRLQTYLVTNETVITHTWSAVLNASHSKLVNWRYCWVFIGLYFSPTRMWYEPYHIAAILYGPYIITCVSIWCLLFWMKALRKRNNDGQIWTKTIAVLHIMNVISWTKCDEARIILELYVDSRKIAKLFRVRTLKNVEL